MFAKTFRNTLIASTLVVAGSMLAAPAMADTFTIGGNVADTSAVTSTPTTEATDLNLSPNLTGEVAKVAVLAVTSNSSDGVTLSVLPNSALTNGPGSVTYKVLHVDPVDGPPLAGDFTVTGLYSDTVDIVAGEATRDLYITYDTPAVLNEGDYTSTITVSVAAL